MKTAIASAHTRCPWENFPALPAGMPNKMQMDEKKDEAQPPPAAPPPVPYISELITLLIGSPEFQQR